MTRRAQLATSVLAVLLLWQAGAPAYSLDLAQFRQLIALSDSYVADLLVSEAAWLGDERGLVLGGWEEWPTRALIVVAPASGPQVKLGPAAAPRFALSPNRQEVAYWAATGGGWCQLAVAPVAGGRSRYVGEPRRSGPAMDLAWPTDHTLCALVQDRGKNSALAINLTTGGARPLVEVEGGQWVRLRKWPAWDPIAVWAGDSKKCFRLSVAGRSDEISADFDYDRARPSSLLFSYFDDAGALWLGGLKDRAPARLAADAGAACWAPDGSMVLYAKRRELWSAWLAPFEARQIMGSALDNAGLEAATPAGMMWSGDGGTCAYWRQAGKSGHVRTARLGLEEIVVRTRFDPGTRATVGQALWIATKLHFDKQGRITEPVWVTVKGKFAVRKLLPGAHETVIEAVSVGAQPGVLVRLAGRSLPESGAVPGSTPLQFTLKPVPDLIAWLHGTHVAGSLVGIEVRRVALGAADR